jgi:enterochelin esterase-like enzyme
MSRILLILTLLPAFAQQHPAPPSDFQWVNPLPKSTHPRVQHAKYFSKIHNADIGYAIYLPPAYDTGATRFPVIYYLHGGRPGSEAKSVAMAAHFDSFINKYPAIYVFSNGGAVSHYDYPAYKSYGERTLIEELIPHIDKTYRTIADWRGRALEGFSQGGRGTARIAFHHPELFCSAAPFGGGHQYERHAFEHDGQEGAPSNYLFAPKFNTYDLARAYAARREHKPRLLIAVGTEDQNYQPNLHWMAYLDSLGVQYRKIIVPNVKHDARGVYRFVGEKSMEFHAACFADKGNVAK